MMLTTEDRLAIHELLARHGHLCDAGAFERLGEVMVPDVVYDVSDLGGGVMHGLDQVRDTAFTLGAGNPVAHLVTNVTIGTAVDGEVEVASKGLGLTTDGRLGCVVYLDHVVRTDVGWRIARRRVLARREPLAAYDVPG